MCNHDHYSDEDASSRHCVELNTLMVVESLLARSTSEYLRDKAAVQGASPEQNFTPFSKMIRILILD